MTIVVTVKINDGIVLAADSATTFSNEIGEVIKVYNNANKIFNLVKGMPIGALTFGAGSIGAASVATITKDLRKILSGDEISDIIDPIDKSSYTIKEVANTAYKYFRHRLEGVHGASPPAGFFLGYKVCGYSAGARHPELWNVPISGLDNAPTLVAGEEAVGPNWDGEYEAMDRLLLGLGTNFRQALINRGMPEEQVSGVYQGLAQDLRAPVVLAAMPIQDAIELARFMVETTIRFVRFNLRSETVGGPIEVAAITKHEGFRWVQRKLFFQSDLNPHLG